MSTVHTTGKANRMSKLDGMWMSFRETPPRLMWASSTEEEVLMGNGYWSRRREAV